jgi:AAA+ superfamily predicted ATPase
MPTYNQIKQQIDLNPFAMLMLRNELKALPAIIQSDEFIDASVHGYWNGLHALLLATSKRILLIDSDNYGDVEVVEFPYSKEVSIRCPRPDAVIFGDEKRKYKVDNAIEEYIKNFYDVVSIKLEGKEPIVERNYDLYSEQEAQKSENDTISNPFNILMKGWDGITQMLNRESKEQTQEPSFIKTDTKPIKVEPARPLEELLTELNGLIGLQNVKDEVNNLVNILKVEKIRKEQGLAIPERSLHSVFHGNPGTGKTTIARLLAKIYQSLGVLSKGHLYETDRSGLVAGYTGQTALKTAEVCQKSLGGILFIDEAYALNTTDTFGPEAVNTIVKFMEDHRDDFVVIVAGYEKPMKDFIDSNPGLKSRFNKYIEFKDYSPQELLDIYLINLKKAQLNANDAAKEKVLKIFTKLHEGKDESFGNGRLARNIFEKTYERQANRLVKEGIEKADLSLITADDVPDLIEFVKDDK